MPAMSRIPAHLQAVFLASNAGEEITAAPEERVVVNRKHQSQTVYESKKKKVYSSSSDKVLSKKIQEQKGQLTASMSQRMPKLKSEAWEGTLQEYFDALLLERGYDSMRVFETLETGYCHKASDLQIASYGPRMIEIIKSNDVAALRECMDWGISPNPCNQFSESLLHMACRRGHIELLEVFVEAGACLQVADDYGRTPLHDACWAANPCFDVVNVLIQKDATMFFMKDKRGSLPLSYVHKDDWPEWREWLDENIDNYFPESEAGFFSPSDMVTVEPNTFPLSSKSEFSLELVKLVARGDLTPQEALLLVRDDETYAETVDETEYDDEDSDYYDSDEDSSIVSEDLDGIFEFIGIPTIEE